MAQNYGLGRGLSSLIPQKKINKDDGQSILDVNQNNLIGSENARQTNEKASKDNFNQGVLEVEIGKVLANPYQPRMHFDEEKLKELADSIKEHGVLQPLVVTKKGDQFELIAGERRLQASKLADLSKVPIIIKDVKDKQKLELAIVENIQRHNLNPVEEAKSFQQLMNEFQMSQEEVAQKLGKSRSVVANKIRLLKLPIEAVKALKDGVISEGHAKAILSLENPEKQRALLDLIIKNHWTVRQAENKTKEISSKPFKRLSNTDPEIKELEDKLAMVMGTKVKVTKSGGDGGKIIIDYYSSDELNKIIQNLSNEKKMDKKKEEYSASLENDSIIDEVEDKNLTEETKDESISFEEKNIFQK